MARPRSISNEQILEAAREVFLEHGYRAPTSRVAKRAGVSEGTIFQRFPTKAQLFEAAMGTDWSFPWLSEPERAAANADELRAQLLEIAHSLHAFFLELIPRMVLRMGGPRSTIDLFRDHPDPPPIRVLRHLNALFERAQGEGALPVQADPLVLARTFLGTIHHLAFSEVAGLYEHLPCDTERTIEQLLGLLLGTPSPTPATP